MENLNTNRQISIPQQNLKMRDQEIDAWERGMILRQNNERFKRCGAYENDLAECGFDKMYIVPGCQPQERLVNLCRKFLNEITEGRTNRVLLLYGNSSTGKTHAALSILKQWFNTQKAPVVITDSMGRKVDAGIVQYHSGYYTTSADLCKLMHNSSYEGRNERELKVKKMQDGELLIIDEIGRSNETAKKERDSLFDILNYRISTNRPTVICTNYTEDEMVEAFGDALFKRINGAAVLFNTSSLPNFRSQDLQTKIKDAKK